jgi:hypothetical protein
MQTPEAALLSAMAPRGVSLGILSAVGEVDQAGIAALDRALADTIAIVKERVKESFPNVTFEMHCCLQTTIDIHLAHKTFQKCDERPHIIVPCGKNELLATIGNPALLTTAQTLLTMDAIITELDHKCPKLTAAPPEPQLGQQLVARTADVLFVAVPDREAGMSWVNSLRDEFPFKDGLVVIATPRADESPVTLDFENGEPATRPLQELHHRLLQQLSEGKLAEATTERTPFATVPRLSIGGLFNVFLAFIVRTWPPEWQFVLAPSSKELSWPRDISKDFEKAAAAELDTLRDRFAQPFAWAHSWAIHFGNVFRTVCMLLVALNVVAVATAVAGYFTHHAGWYCAELASLVAIATLYVWTRRSHIQQKWVQFRLLAEMLRPTQYFWAMADMYTPVEPHVQERELKWWTATVTTYRSLLRGIPRPPLQMTPQYAYALSKILTGLLINQINWYEAIAEAHSKVHRRLLAAGRVAYCLVVMAAAGHLVTRWVGTSLEPVAGAEHIWSGVFLATASGLAALGFAIGFLIHQIGFDEIAERSEIAARELRRLLTRVQNHRILVTRENLGRWLADCSHILIAEQNAWFRQTSRIAIHL